MSENILIKSQDRVMQIQISRAEKKNALTQDMYSSLADAIEEAESDDDIRVILIHGLEECFTSGNDMTDFLSVSILDGVHESPIQVFMHTLVETKKPIIAAVNGLAVGIGTTMLLHCDLVFAGTSTRFQLPFANIGLCPEFASSYMLPALMGRVKASELLLLGEPFTAEIACQLGIINKVFADEDVVGEAYYCAQKLVSMPPNALRSTKLLLKESYNRYLNEVIARELEVFSELLKSEEAKEAVSAFLEKRKPDFSRFN